MSKSRRDAEILIPDSDPTTQNTYMYLHMKHTQNMKLVFCGPVIFIRLLFPLIIENVKKGYIKLVQMDVTVKGRRGRPHIMYIFLLWILSQVDCLVYLIGCHVHCRQKCIAMKLYYYFNTICMRRLKNKTLRLWHIRVYGGDELIRFCYW